MDYDYEFRLMNVFENIDILLTASNNFEYFDFYPHPQNKIFGFIQPILTDTQAVKDNFDNCASKTASRPGYENFLIPQAFFPIYISILSHTNKTYTTCKLTGGSGSKISTP